MVKDRLHQTQEQIRNASFAVCSRTSHTTILWTFNLKQSTLDHFQFSSFLSLILRIYPSEKEIFKAIASEEVSEIQYHH